MAGFYCVYLLVSRCERPRIRGRCYVGFTVNPTRRLKQHNAGADKGGARRTSSRGPWDMQLLVHGFPNMVSALRFEWAWQHPKRSRRLRDVPSKRSNERSFAFHFRLLGEMLRTAPWNRLALTFRNLRPDLQKLEFPAALQPPCHIRLEVGPLDKTLPGQQTESDSDLDLDDSLLCALCIEPVAIESQVRCLSRKCRAIAHVRCLSEHFLAAHADQSRLIPIQGKCPVCEEECRWGDIVRSMKKRPDVLKDELEVLSRLEGVSSEEECVD